MAICCSPLAAFAAKPVIITLTASNRQEISLHALAFAAFENLRPTRLSPVDLAIVAVYLIAITLFGLRFREKKGAAPADKSLKSYFLANNTIPWWAIALSIVSAETSTLTIISVPGIAFAGNFGFLQLVIGYMLGRIVVALLFLPRYFAGEMLTAYQLIDRRFGPVLHKVTAGLFLLTRAAAEGVRVFAVSIVVGIAIGTGDVLSIGIISALTLLYTFEGGMTAVIWTDVVQMFLYVAGTLVAVFTLGSHVGFGSFINGWHMIYTVAAPVGKFHMLDFTLNLTSTYTFWAGVFGGTFLTMASHGTDQLMVQRMLAARNLRESRLALLSSGVVIFLQFTLFLLIGVGLWVYYGILPKVGGTQGFNTADLSSPIHNVSPDRIFPTFIVHEMPIGIAGLLVAAILAAAMSNLSAALNSLSSTTVVDFYMRLRPQADARERGIISKSSTVLWALVLFAIAVYSVGVGGKGHVVEIGLSIASVAYGCLLGVFLLGTLTKYATEVGATIGMVIGFAVNLIIWLTPANGGWTYTTSNGTHLIPIPHIAYPWYTLIGAIVTFAIGTLFSLIFRKQSKRTITTAALLFLLLLLSFPQGICFTAAAQQQRDPHRPTHLLPLVDTPDFTPITTLLTDFVAAHKLPGAVVLIGHNGQVVFHRAYGNRKLAGEPGLEGKPSPAEPMTEDTLFDMASLTKCLATATAIMQLYEQGKITSFDDPIAKYLPDFLTPISDGAHTATPISALSAEGAATSQPGPKAQVNARTNSRAESPTHTVDPATNDRARVTLRMLLTHTSGEAPDVSLKDPWGLAAPDRAEGLHRALTTPLTGTPGAKFVYSDINFILLGALIEKLSGQREDDYVRGHIYKPLHMNASSYHAFDRVCAFSKKISGSAIEIDSREPQPLGRCRDDSWPAWVLLPQTAPTAHDDESKSNPALNPNFDHLLRGTVHDPTTRRMGGVAGHAGLFSTAHDVSRYAQALLDKLRNNTGPFPLKQSTLQLMTTPQQPATNPGAPSSRPLLGAKVGIGEADLTAANRATAASIAAGDKPAEPGLAPHYPAIPNQNLRGYGWDIDTAFSKPRGDLFPIGSFGHTGFTGTSLWMDPASNTYVILLANAIHPRGNTPISNLRGQVATAAAQALGLGTNGYPEASASGLIPGKKDEGLQPPRDALARTTPTQTGIDILESTNFTALTTLATQHNNSLRLAIFTNQAGLDRNGHRTLDILSKLTADNIHLTTLFSPEHGLTALSDTEKIPSETDAATGLHVTSLYGATAAARHPTHDMLKDLDAVVIDLQDAGVHFWTYEAAMGYFLEAAVAEQLQYDHRLDIVILDRPNLVGGEEVQGPVSDAGLESYTNYMPLPARHGMTFGELAQLFYTHIREQTPTPALAPRYKATHEPPMLLDATTGKVTQMHPTSGPETSAAVEPLLTVIKMQNWTRGHFFDETGLPWTNPSPNLRSMEAAVNYPALGLIETTNLSVGRGTTDPNAQPFTFFGAGTPARDAKTGEQKPAWFKGAEVAAALTARHIAGVKFAASRQPIVEDANHYPYHGQTIEAVRLIVTDRNLLDTPQLGIEILAVLHRLYPTQFNLAGAMRLIDSKSTLAALTRGDDPRAIRDSWQPALETFKVRRAASLLY